MSCSYPIDVGVLTEYWLATLPKAEEDAVETHLLGCDQCGDRLREVIALAEAVRNLTRAGSLLMVVSESFVSTVSEQGLRVREYTVSPGGSVACTVAAEDDFLIGRLTSDLRSVKRVDLSFCDGLGIERVRLPDIPFDSGTRSVIFQQSIAYAKAASSETMIARLITFDDGGSERVLGEYTFNHTRSLPGIGAS